MAYYVAFLRGVNVGGKALIKMADLAAALQAAGFTNAHTYIQSGNVIFASDLTNNHVLAQRMQGIIAADFGIHTEVAVFSQAEWDAIIDDAPTWWGSDPTWKHNVLIFTEPIASKTALAAIGTLKPDIEAIQAGNGVMYQSMSLALFGRTTTGKLAANPLYKKLTIRNFNTATKLRTLLDVAATETSV